MTAHHDHDPGSRRYSRRRMLPLAAALLLGLLASLTKMHQAQALDTGFGTTSLNRTYLGLWQTHFVSAANTFTCANGSYTCGFSNEGTLGYLLNDPRANTVAIYNCYEGSFDFFLSRDAACEGQRRWNPNQAEGYIYTAPPNDGNAVDPIYRCRRLINGHLDHFATTLANCEGQILEGTIGYAKHDPQFAPLPKDPETASTVALNRYFNDNSTYGGNHWVTTGPATPDFHPEGAVAHILKTPVQGTVPLYGCYARGKPIVIDPDNDDLNNPDSDDKVYNHDDHFVSTDVNCEGWKADNTLGSQYLHMLGFVFQKPIEGATVAIYRCHRTGDHYVTQAANCEGAGASEGILGYAYANPTKLQMFNDTFEDYVASTDGTKELQSVTYKSFVSHTIETVDGVDYYLCTWGAVLAATSPVATKTILTYQLEFDGAFASPTLSTSDLPYAETNCFKGRPNQRVTIAVKANITWAGGPTNWRSPQRGDYWILGGGQTNVRVPNLPPFGVN